MKFYYNIKIVYYDKVYLTLTNINKFLLKAFSSTSCTFAIPINFKILLDMLTQIHPKLPMRDAHITKAFYLDQLKFDHVTDYGDYLILEKDKIELHFFLFKDLDPKENYGQTYIRTDDIDALYQSFLDHKVEIHPNGHLDLKPWGQIEFSLLDPDHNLLTFGQSV